MVMTQETPLPGSNMSTQNQTEIILRFILPRLASFNTSPHHQQQQLKQQPLFLGLQGPQGIGKTWLSEQIREELHRIHKINAIVISLDDFYLTRKEQRVLETQLDPTNRLVRGRGLPGTHDLELARKTLLDLRNINIKRNVQLPIYDKSVEDGLGDRVGFKKVILDDPNQLVHLVILEGWMVGFLSLEINRLELKFKQSTNHQDFHMSRYTLEELLKINQNLKNYYHSIWSFLDLCILLVPKDFNFIWRWRLQQELDMKSKNGGIGMSEERVQKFISKFMPCYELYARRADEEEEGKEDETGVSWSLKIILDQNRKVVDVKLGTQNSPQS